jgi:predicted membrane-bound spermidine synthase
MAEPSRQGPRRIAAALPYAVVFLTSMGIMIVELVASRLVAKYVGNSLYTWTGVIGIILGGISLGNWLGGRLADRFPPRSAIPFILGAASVLTVLIVVLDLAASILANVIEERTIAVSVPLASFVLVAGMFFLPSCAMGTVAPVMAKYALDRPGAVGSTVGGIYAAGSLGSIAGTFLTGYLMIPLLGLTVNVIIVAAMLAALSLLMGGWKIATGAWLVLLAVVSLTGAPQALALKIAAAGGTQGTPVYVKDSPYSYIRVSDIQVGPIMERDLRLDALIHNQYEAANPDNLLYAYESMFASLTRAEVKRLGTQAPRTLTLGGGAFTMPAWLERHYPRGSHQVAEIDPDVVDTAHRFFDLPADTAIEVSIGDARTFVNTAPGRSFDIVYCDVFNAFSVPAHLTTREFLRKTSGMLDSRGLLLVNLIDIFDSGRFLGAYLNTVRSVFPHVSVYIPSDAGWATRTTFVIAAGWEDAGLDVLRDEQGVTVGTLVPDEKLAELAARTGTSLLTDDHAPVENLLTPVFRESGN